MPSPQEVFENIEGSDASDTAAKRAGAMFALADMIAQRAGDRYYKKPWLTADENKLRKVYQTAEYSIVTPMLDSFDKAETARLTVNIMAQQTESTGFLVALVWVFVICLVIQSQVTKRRIDRLKVQLTDFARQSNF